MKIKCFYSLIYLYLQAAKRKTDESTKYLFLFFLFFLSFLEDFFICALVFQANNYFFNNLISIVKIIMFPVKEYFFWKHWRKPFRVHNNSYHTAISTFHVNMNCVGCPRRFLFEHMSYTINFTTTVDPHNVTKS